MDSDKILESNDSNASDNFLHKTIKVEVDEDDYDQKLLLNQEIFAPEDPLKTIEEIKKACDEIKSEPESDSETPVSKDEDSKSSVPLDKSKNNILHIKDGIWLATCYGEETTDKRISQEKLDKFLTKNIDHLCDHCPKRVNTFTELQAHFQKEHKTEKAYLTCCDKKFYLRAPLVDHIIQHKYPNYFTCLTCSKVLTGRKTLHEHEKTHNKKLVYQCPGCEKKFHRKICLDRHKDVHVDYSQRTVECPQCDKLFASKFSLKQHLYDVHKNSSSHFVCELCGKVFRDQPSLRRHQVQHSVGEKEYFFCDLCPTRLSSKDGLRRHKKYQHPQEDIKYICTYCGLQSTTAKALHRHVTYMHTEEPKYKCTLCEKAFKRAMRLKEHMTTHTGEVLYTCPHCPKTFNSNANMHSHRKKMHRKEWEENRRHPHLGTSANAAANRQAMANQNASEDNNTQ